ncbi:MAG TPA: M20/M25/M40 family metallo-hydrolase [bacterium]|nr:M20/M25/M40 family metallo-hydrolase [bacterium]
MDMATYLERTLCDLIAIRSVTGEEAAISQYIHESLAHADVRVERDAEGNVTAEVGSGDRLLVVNGHMDTVPPVDGWTQDPFSPRLENGRVTGLGASDMKAGLACMMWLAQHVRPNVRTWFAFTNNEEGGAVTPRNGVRRLIGRVTPDYAITTEPSYDETKKRLSIGIGCQGRAIGHLTVIGRSGHSSDWRRADNAIYRGVDVIKRIAETASRHKAVDVAPGVQSVPSLSVVAAKAGIATNIIPDRLRLTVDRRLAPGENYGTFEGELRGSINGTTHELEIEQLCLPTLADRNGRTLSVAVAELTRLQGHAPLQFSQGRQDLSIFAERTTDFVNLGPGSSGQAHNAGEHATVAGMVAAATALRAVIEGI